MWWCTDTPCSVIDAACWDVKQSEVDKKIQFPAAVNLLFNIKQDLDSSLDTAVAFTVALLTMLSNSWAGTLGGQQSPHFWAVVRAEKVGQGLAVWYEVQATQFSSPVEDQSAFIPAVMLLAWLMTTRPHLTSLAQLWVLLNMPVSIHFNIFRWGI